MRNSRIVLSLWLLSIVAYVIYAAREKSASGELILGAIADFAASIGICPGVVVGQMQHHKFIPPSHYWDLRRKLKWADFRKKQAQV